ncbi:MAG: hypothetical protein P9M06_08110 [Candidatus Saelkia tenebricola]|nr:hypothetical protein [Candidatus Saelkia tenebricola]
MDKKQDIKPKTFGQWIGLGILFIGVVVVILTIITEIWAKLWTGIVIGIVGVVFMIISKKLLD